MKTALSLFALLFAFNASAADPGQNLENTTLGKAVMKYLDASPAVSGAMAQIKLEVKGNHPRKVLKCSAVKLDTLAVDTFEASASCLGSDGPSETEFSSFITIKGEVYGNGDSFHIDNIQFQMAD
jgi:hypothetical protein